MQLAFYLAGELTQVLDAIPWVRCASGNVFSYKLNIGGRKGFHPAFNVEFKPAHLGKPSAIAEKVY